MEMKITDNKDMAFSGFLKNVSDMGKYQWIQDWQSEYMDFVPKKLAEESSIIFNFVPSFEGNPYKELKEWKDKVFSVMEELEEIHDKKWEENRDKIQIFVESHRKIFSKFPDLLEIIQSHTKIEWKYDECYIIPSIYGGSSTVDNKIFRGILKKTEDELTDIEDLIPGLIHELIHINEQPKFLSRMNRKQLLELVIEERKEFKNPNMTREITTTILTNEIIEKLKNNYDLDLEKQETHPHYPEKYLLELEKELEVEDDIKSMMKELDEKLDKN